MIQIKLHFKGQRVGLEIKCRVEKHELTSSMETIKSQLAAQQPLTKRGKKKSKTTVEPTKKDILHTKTKKNAQ